MPKKNDWYLSKKDYAEFCRLKNEKYEFDQYYAMADSINREGNRKLAARVMGMAQAMERKHLRGR